MRISWESQDFPFHLLTINNFISVLFANIQRKCRRLHILFAPPNRDRLKVDLNILMNSYKFQKGNDVKNIQLLMELFFLNSPKLFMQLCVSLIIMKTFLTGNSV